MADRNPVVLNPDVPRLETPQTGDRLVSPVDVQVPNLEAAGSITLNGVARNQWGTVIDSGTATGGTATTLQDTGKDWGASGLEGSVVRMTGGTGAGQVRRIASHTANTLTVTDAWTTTPDTTSTYEIYGVGNQTLAQVFDTTGDRQLVGNVSESEVFIPLNQVEYQPFASDTVTLGTAADDATWGGGLRTMTITLSAAIPGLADGDAALIGGRYYPIDSVAGTGVVLAYDPDLGDPTATDVVFCKVRFAGRYPGRVNYARASRMSYIDRVTGYLRVAAIDHPAWQLNADDEAALIYEPSVVNKFGSNHRTAAAWSVWTGSPTIAQNAVGVDGVANAAVTITGASTAVFDRMAIVSTVAADTNRRCMSILIGKNSATNIPQFTVNVGGAATGAYVDTATGALSTDTDSRFKIEDFSRDFWRLSFSEVGDGATTTIRWLVTPAERATLNGVNDSTLTGSVVVDWPQCDEGNPPTIPIHAATSLVPGGSTRAPITLLLNGKVERGPQDDITMAIDYQPRDVTTTQDVIRINDAAGANAWIRLASFRRNVSASGTAPTVGTVHRLLGVQSGTTVEFWWGGVQQSTATITTYANRFGAGLRVSVGYSHYDGNYCNGLLSNLRIWGRALTPMERAAA